MGERDDDAADPNASDAGFVDPHLHGACCDACGFAAELERTGVAPPVRGQPQRFPVDAAGRPLGAAFVVHGSRNPRDSDVHDVRGVSVEVGRAATNDIVLASDEISRKQMRFDFTPDGVVVRDLKSGCGTFVNGKRVNEATLCDGDKILAGNWILELIRIPT